MKKLIGFLLLSCTLALISCNLFPTSSIKANGKQPTADYLRNDTGAIVLGDKIYNPFSVRNLMERGVNIGDSDVNWYYFRVRSTFTNPEEDRSLKFLKETFGFLETTPIDYEIASGGYYYDDPDVDEENECPWIYFMKPVDDYKLIVDSGYDFEIEILDEMYVEPGLLEALEKADVDEDEVSRFVTISSMKNIIDDDPSRWLGGTWRKPSGYVYFDDYDGALDKYDNFTEKKHQPLYGITVASSQLILTSSTVTDRDGYYYINRSYGSWFGNVRLRLVFSNNRYEFNGLGKWWEYICDAYEYVGTVSTPDLPMYAINLNDSDYQRANRLANLHDAIVDYYDFCQETGINPPTRCLRIWLNEDGNGSACTIYAREGLISELWTTLGAFGFFGGPLSGITTMIVMNAVSNWFPDIVMTGFKHQFQDLDQIHHLWHELSHASHFGASKRSYLTKEYFEMLKSIPNYPEDSDLVDVIESWGYFAEDYMRQWQRNKVSGTADFNEYDFRWRGYSHSLAKLILNHSNIGVGDIFKALIDTTSINDFISKLSSDKKLTKGESDQIRSYFTIRAPLNW